MSETTMISILLASGAALQALSLFIIASIEKRVAALERLQMEHRHA